MNTLPNATAFNRGGLVDHPPDILILGPEPSTLSQWLEGAKVTRASSWMQATELLQQNGYTSIVADPKLLSELFGSYRRDQLVLSGIQSGIAVLDLVGNVTWAHTIFCEWCGQNPIGQSYFAALEAETVASDDGDPFAVVRKGLSTSFRVHRPNNEDRPFLDVVVRPIHDSNHSVHQMIAMARNVTPEVEQQRRLDALHQAGRELAGLDPDQLAEMNIPTRIELLRQNLRRYIHDLLEYDIIEVRLVDRKTHELKPLLEDGMTPSAASRVLHAHPIGNGVTGFVAATGESYLCGDTSNDALYLEGASDARSSMTVPLKYQDEVVGTLNVESPRLNAFGAEDLQFTELFSKEIAAALHTLDLLSAQESCTAAQSLEAINREIVLPVDEILSSASILLQQLEGNDEATVLIHRILAGARAVKTNVRKVADDLPNEQGLNNAPPCPLTHKQVLVIDADERMRRSAHLVLSRLGAAVETAGTAGEGIALLANTSFDAVLMDIKPKDMGGYEAYRRLRAARPEALIAMMTTFGYDAAHSILKARQEGLKHVLFKPFRPEQLIAALQDEAPTLEAAALNGSAT